MKTKKIFASVLVLSLFASMWIAELAFGRVYDSSEELPSKESALEPYFTYQGQLQRDNQQITDECNMAFRLYDHAFDGNQISTAITTTVPITDSLFNVELDFGSSAFNGEARWLGVKVKCSNDTNFSDMGRQELTASPYAIYALRASWGGLINVPPSFADGVDDDTTYTAGDGLELIANQFKGKGTPYQNVIIVSKGGGDFNSIQAALDSIVDASAENRYLVWVAPGTYNERVTMKPYVSIEGGGELQTQITFVGSDYENTGTVEGADNSELRFLTVKSSSGTVNIAIYNEDASPLLTNVTAIAEGGTNSYGIINKNSSPKMIHIHASASGGSNQNRGVLNGDYSSPVMTYVTATATGGTDSCGINSSHFSSPKMTDVTASASDGTEFNVGITSGQSSPTMVRVNASGSGGLRSDGVLLGHCDEEVSISDLIAFSNGTEISHGVHISECSMTIRNSDIRAVGGSSLGLIMEGGTTGKIYNIKVDN